MSLKIGNRAKSAIAARVAKGWQSQQRRVATHPPTPKQPDVERWADGTPKRKLDRLREAIDLERFHATGDLADPEYQASVHEKMSELVRLEAEEAKGKPPAGTIIVSDEDAKQMQTNLRNFAFQREIDAIEARRPPEPEPDTK